MPADDRLDAWFLESIGSWDPRPLPAGIEQARADVLAAVRDLLAVPEEALTRPWAWIGGAEEEVRYGAYRAFEVLELTEGEGRASAALIDAVMRELPASAARIIAPATAARWDLWGLLMPLPEALLDADPGGGEWTIRQTLGHVVSGQRAYGRGTAWWLANGYDSADPALPAQVPDAVWADLPDEAEEGVGAPDDVRARLDTILDLGTERLAGIPDERLEYGARWSRFAVTVGFRLGRWSSHIREHTIQVEKILALLRHVPSEPERLARLLLAAYGRAEATAFGRPAAVAAPAVERILQGAAEARATIQAVREAAAI